MLGVRDLKLSQLEHRAQGWQVLSLECSAGVRMWRHYESGTDVASQDNGVYASARHDQVCTFQSSFVNPGWTQWVGREQFERLQLCELLMTKAWTSRIDTGEEEESQMTLSSLGRAFGWMWGPLVETSRVSRAFCCWS